jgi:hypothetical protein
LKIRQLLHVLHQVRDLYSVGGATAQTKELDALIQALAPDCDIAVEKFVSQVEEFSKPKPKKEKKPAKAVDPNVIAKFLQSLKGAEDLDQVDGVIAIMKHDKIDKKHVYEIAAQFSGDEPRFGKTADAFARIKSAFVEQKRFENKLRAAHLD